MKARETEKAKRRGESNQNLNPEVRARVHASAWVAYRAFDFSKLVQFLFAFARKFKTEAHSLNCSKEMKLFVLIAFALTAVVTAQQPAVAVMVRYGMCVVCLCFHSED
jgi:hypothetical protein